ncbi:hypothetical protein BDW62DRAFT_189236 [Aspergillus aurantiobrunneus]
MAQPELQTSIHTEAMAKACASGDIAALQKIYETYNTKQGPAVVWPRDETKDGEPATWKLVTAAISHSHVPMVAHLLSTHPNGHIDTEDVISAILQHPNIEIMNLVHSHSPGAVNFEFNPHRHLPGRSLPRGLPDRICCPQSQHNPDHPLSAGQWRLSKRRLARGDRRTQCSAGLPAAVGCD